MAPDKKSDIICSTCLNLEYDLFDDGNGNGGDGTGLGLDRGGFGLFRPFPRYRRLARARIEETSKDCNVCRVLHQGMSSFWIDGRQDDQICIELRPGRALSVMRWEPYCDSLFIVTPRLDYYIDMNDTRKALHEAFGNASHILEKLDLDSAVKVLKNWLRACEKHPDCAGTPPRLPRRLLDISSAVPRLIETQGMQPRETQYMTLSHCWGTQVGKTPLRTTRGTYAQRTRRIEWDDLPRLFQDVILIAKGLGCQHIWIDSLCIIQDNKEDWAREAVKMADIYSYGYLNLAAASGTNSSCTLFHQREHLVGRDARGDIRYSYKDTHAIELPEANMATIHVRPGNKHTHDSVFGFPIQQSAGEIPCPLLDRAWVFQEKLLSRRSAFFARSELLWQCRESTCCECGDVDSFWNLQPQFEHMHRSPPWQEQLSLDAFFGVDAHGLTKGVFSSIIRKKCSVQTARDFWLATVATYTAKMLTMETDRALAIAGIAQRIREFTKDTYLAGIWLEDLPRGLLWMGGFVDNAARNDRFPSWSWLSVSDASGTGRTMVTYAPAESLFAVDDRIQIIPAGTFCKAAENHEFDQVTSGQIELVAPVIPAQVAARKEPERRQKYRLDFEDGTTPLRLDCPEDPNEMLHAGDDVLCMLIGAVESMFMVVLRPVQGRHGVYRRVGYAAYKSETALRDAEVHRMIII